jgi:peptidoglycan/xylan/chitin deacetylase (PgdA/CDA1 family)
MRIVSGPLVNRIGTGKLLVLSLIGVLLLAAAYSATRFPRLAMANSSPRPEPSAAALDLYNPVNRLFKRGRRDRKAVCLTFDDGPRGKILPPVLDALKEYGVKATFFMVGHRILEHPDQVREVLREGHEVGNHSETHSRLDVLTPDQVRAELSLCENNFRQATGMKMKLFRPPGMRFSPAVLKVAAEFGYTTVSGNYGARDFQLEPGGPTVAGPEEIAEFVLNNVTPGGIILLHENFETAEALPKILKGLIERGFEFKTVTQMLADLPKPVHVESNAGRLGKIALK